MIRKSAVHGLMMKRGNTLISEDLLEEFFVCHIEKCKGACCVEGDLGAPLEAEELRILEEVYEKVRPFLSEEGKQAIDEQGLYVRDFEGDYSTPTVGGRECAYAIYDDRGNLKCGIEKAWEAGKTNFRKPVSCHLYPVRIRNNQFNTAVNYDSWHICNPACILGRELHMPVYRFLRDALIRKFGEAWYEELDRVAHERVKDREDPAD